MASIIITASMTQAAIQAEFDGAAPDTVFEFASGTYLLTSALRIDKSLTILGTGESGVIFDATGIPAGSGQYGIEVTANNVTLEGFTLIGGGATGAERGIKAWPTTAEPDGLTGLTIDHVTVQNFNKAEIDLNGVDGALITDVTVDGLGTKGAGIALTDSNDIELNNITAVNNQWGGVAIYTGGDDFADGNSGIHFEGYFTAGGATQPQPILTQVEGASNALTNLTLPDGYDYAVYNDSYRSQGDSAEFLTYFDSTSDAAAYAAALNTQNGGNTASVIYENDGADDQAFELGDVVAQGIIVAEGMSIQAAINAAPEGATIWVGAGTYTENLLISKSLTLLSIDGPGSTIINGTTTGGQSGTIMVADGANDVTIGDIGHGFTINGFDNPTNPSQETAAVYLLSNSTQIGIDDFTLRGNIVNANGDAALLSKWDAKITDAVIDGNTFGGKTFQGATPATGDQFSVQNVARQLVVFGQGGSPSTNKADNIDFTNNTITGVAGSATAGDNIVTIDAKNSLISGNTFSGYSASGRFDLRARGPNTEISNNTIDHQNNQSQSNGFFVQNNTTGPFTGQQTDRR